MWKKRTSVGYFVVTFTLLLPVTAMPSHPHSAYEPDAVPWIGIALSGGGLRAAAFSHGVMLELRKLCLLKRQEDSTDSDDHNGHTTPARFSLHYLEDQEYSDDDRSSPCGRGGGASFLETPAFCPAYQAAPSRPPITRPIPTVWLSSDKGSKTLS